MATLNLRRFTKYETLTAIRPAHLLQLLDPYKDYFTSRGATLPAQYSSFSAFPYAPIIQVLMAPDATTPPDLIEALYTIDEMATPLGHEAMIETLEHTPLGGEVDEGATALDLAIQIWLKDRRLLERLQAEQKLQRTRTFEYFRARRDSMQSFTMPDRTGISRIEAELNRWFMKKRRGRTAQVYAYDRPDGVWFLVRHGEPFRHENVIRDGESTCIFFRPEKFDVVICDPQTGEIRINTKSKGERELYRTTFGLHLFGSAEFFSERSRFDLEPLRRDGRAALMCRDVPGLEWIKLKEIQLGWGGPHDAVETQRAKDVFAALEYRRAVLPGEPRIIKASFLVKFTDAKAECTVSISSVNRAQYKRDDDGRIFEDWMRRRGFLSVGEVTAYAAA